MKIFTRAIYEFIDGHYKLVAESSRLYFGSVEYTKGASGDQKALEKSQQNFYNTIIAQQKTAFGAQQALYGAIRSVYDPIIAAGPSQYGYAKPEDVALRTQASESTANQFRQAQSATSQAMAARGGGNTFLPSGVEADVNAKLAGQAAATESGRQLDITKSGYETGRQNFLNATGTEMGIAAGYNPLGYAGAATSAGALASNTASEIQKANAAASPWGTIGGLVGGVAGSFLEPIGSQFGNKVGGFLGNAGSGNIASTPETQAGGLPF